MKQQKEQNIASLVRCPMTWGIFTLSNEKCPFTQQANTSTFYRPQICEVLQK